MDIRYDIDTYKFIVTSPEGIEIAVVDDAFLAKEISDMFNRMIEQTKTLDNIKSRGRI